MNEFDECKYELIDLIRRRRKDDISIEYILGLVNDKQNKGDEKFNRKAQELVESLVGKDYIEQVFVILKESKSLNEVIMLITYTVISELLIQIQNQ